MNRTKQWIKYSSELGSCEMWIMDTASRIPYYYVCAISLPIQEKHKESRNVRFAPLDLSIKTKIFRSIYSVWRKRYIGTACAILAVLSLRLLTCNYFCERRPEYLDQVKCLNLCAWFDGGCFRNNETWKGKSKTTHYYSIHYSIPN